MVSINFSKHVYLDGEFMTIKGGEFKAGIKKSSIESMSISYNRFEVTLINATYSIEHEMEYEEAEMDFIEVRAWWGKINV